MKPFIVFVIGNYFIRRLRQHALTDSEIIKEQKITFRKIQKGEFRCAGGLKMNRMGKDGRYS